jgi:NADPH-dependent glutamate synthase beta subunit-like oxidoreductase
MSQAVRQKCHKPDVVVEDAVDAAAGKSLLAPCQIACPIGENIQRTNVFIASLPNYIKDAMPEMIRISDELFDSNPLFSVCGYVCGLCERECNYRDKGGAVRRRLLKRFLGDLYMAHLKGRPKMDVPRNNTKVAVVGAGPGGLMCAWELGKKGYSVTMFEKSPEAGGAVRLIPKYRLPNDVLDTTLDGLIRIAGIEFLPNTKVESLTGLMKQGYKAVFVATGTSNARPLSFEGKPVACSNVEGVFLGIDFLIGVHHGKFPPHMFQGKKVVVIGGGNVAFDVARTARRFGGIVDMVCLECEDKTCRDGIPADLEEIEGAEEEGIKIHYSRGVSEVASENGKFNSISCPKCTCVFDQAGFNPKFNKQDLMTIPGDILVVTIGQFPDSDIYRKEGLLNAKGRLEIDPVTLRGLKEGIYIGGDVKRIGFAAEAMRDGIIAADSIDRFIKGEPPRTAKPYRAEKCDFPEVSHTRSHAKVAYVRGNERIEDFDVCEKGLTLGEAIEEAKRCAVCGPCKTCKACSVMEMRREIPEMKVDKDRCSGCGICGPVCPYKAISMRLENGHTVSVTDDLKCKGCGLCVAACPSAARSLNDDFDRTVDETCKGISTSPVAGNILVVDDEDVIRRSLSEWFTSEGYKAYAAANGDQALQMLESNDVDVVFLDLKMPGMDGIQVLKEIMSRKLCPNVVMLTAYGTIQNAVDAMKIGALDYVVKPFRPDDLQKVVEGVLG